MAVNETKDNQTLWVHSSFVIFSEVQRKKLPVDVRCGISLDGNCVGVALSGLFTAIENNCVTYVVDQMTPLPGKSSEDGKTCSFSFVLDRQHVTGSIEKLNFSGRGTVVEIKKNADGKPEQLLLRLAPNLATSKVRREQRIDWKTEDTKVLWCFVTPEPPEKMEDLRADIAAHYQAVKSSISAELKDISASGACLCVIDDSHAKKFSLNDYHMLFFVPTNAAGHPPFTFLGKKVGANRKNEDGTSLMPLHFYYELDWRKSSQTLAWIDIQRIGSERMRHFIKSRSGAHHPHTPVKHAANLT
ncbi:MAG: hypothetical protein LBB66_00195 [Desulfovibrio sp.]|jgi:hypothetical protein|nr:hypothetical protein [Desulfovibrio sp.]